MHHYELVQVESKPDETFLITLRNARTGHELRVTGSTVGLTERGHRAPEEHIRRLANGLLRTLQADF